MKNISKVCLLGLLAIASAFAQLNTLVQTSLSAAITQDQTKFAVASATGISAPSVTGPGSELYVVDIGQVKGERMKVVALSSTTVTVRRDGPGRGAHASGAMVLVAANGTLFNSSNPSGSCVTASTYVSPWVNIETGQQWLCSSKTLTWVPGWGNPSVSPQVLSATATASVAGATAIAGPMVEISGTNAITSFTMGVGWNGQGFCVVPTGAFTTTATNNIGKASTATAALSMCFTYDAQAAKFYPSY